MTEPTIAQLYNLTDRAATGLTPDEQQRLRDGIDQLAALQAVARRYCPACGRGDAAPTVDDWEQQKQRADEAEQRLRNIANGHPRADSIQAEIGEMILQTHELRDQLSAAEEAARRAIAQRQEMAEERYAWQERGDRAETALARQTQETATWRATANTLDAGGPGTPRTRAEQAEAANDRVRRLAARIRQGVPWAANFDNLADRIEGALDGEQQADAGCSPSGPETEPNNPAVPDSVSVIGPPPGISVDEARQMRDELLAATRSALLTAAEEARLAMSDIDTPGCDCGHDGMGVSWHGDDCPWRRSVVDCPGRPTPS